MGVLGLLQNSLLSVGRVNGIVSNSHPSNEPWVFIVLLFFFVLFVFLVYSSDGILIGNLRNFVSEDEKSTNFFSVDRLRTNYFSTLLNCFSVGVFSLFIYLLLYNTEKSFGAVNFFQLMAVTVSFYLFKIISFRVLGFVFFQKSVTEHIIKVYFNLFHLFTFVLYPVIIAYVYLPSFSKEYLIGVSVLLFLLFFIFLIIKLFQYLFTKTIAFLYIILYLCTLEVIPFGVLFRVYSIFL